MKRTLGWVGFTLAGIVALWLTRTPGGRIEPRLPPAPPDKGPHKPAVVDLPSVDAEGIHLTVTLARVRFANQPGKKPRKVLVVDLALFNGRKGEEVRYDGWAHRKDGVRAQLFDGHGREFPMVDFGV